MVKRMSYKQAAEKLWKRCVFGKAKGSKKKEGDLFHLLDWLASEHKYAVDLASDLRAIGAEKNAGKRRKEIRKAVLVLKYIARSERNVDSFEKKFEISLSEALVEVKGSGIDVTFKAELIDSLRSIVSEISVESGKLVEYASQYSGLLAQDLHEVEINKRVLWAKNSKGKVLGRVLIAVDKNKNIVHFPIYYATSLKLDRFFADYVKELAKKCGFGINGYRGYVENLVVGHMNTDRRTVRLEW